MIFGVNVTRTVFSSLGGETGIEGHRIVFLRR
jgi:hypothetical protein